MKGRSVASMAVASTSAEPVLMLSQNTTAKPTIELLSIEKNCPDHMIANVLFQLVMNYFYRDDETDRGYDLRSVVFKQIERGIS